MKRIYDFSIAGALILLRALGRFSPNLKKLTAGRKDVFARLEKFTASNKRAKGWFHVASLGEYEQAKPVIHEFKRRYPTTAIVLTFFSPSGYEHVVKKPQANVDFITYLPFDTKVNARRFIGLLQPKVVFFAKYDLWANFIFTLKENNIPLYLFSASLRKGQVYFKGYGGFFRKMLHAFDHIFAQNQETINLLNSIDYYKTTLTGDTRYDNVRAISQRPRDFPEIANFIDLQPTIVVGSAWEEDMALIIPFINQHPSYKFIIAPHDINTTVIESWQKEINTPSLRYSTMEAGATQERVLFIDNIGMLSSLYQYAKIAYVGGAFGKGLHNILEPLAFGIPVIFGKLKNPSKFPEGGISEAYGCGFPVSNRIAFEETVLNLEKKEAYQKARKSATRLVNDNLGSAGKIMAIVQQNISSL